MYVTDLPSVIINVDEICTSSIIISFSTHSHPACGDVSHNVTISDNVIYQDINHMHDGSSNNYTIDKLQSDTLYNITVTSTYNSGSRIVYRSVRTSLPKCKFPLICITNPIGCLMFILYYEFLDYICMILSFACYVFLCSS